MERYTRPGLTHPSPLHIRLRVEQALRERGLASWAISDAVLDGIKRAVAEHEAAQAAQKETA